MLCLNYQPTADGELRPVPLPIQFLYIPPDAEVVSIDAFCSSPSTPPVVGITLVKTSPVGKDNKHFLNIYGARLNTYAAEDEGEQTSEVVESAWKDIGEDWQACDLAYTPLKLTHVLLQGCGEAGDEEGFLLSGSDQRVHLFRSMPKPKPWREDASMMANLFPELSRVFGSCVTSLACRTEQSARFTAVGCENGQVNMYVVDTSVKREPRVVSSWSSDCFDGPLTSVCLFHSRHEAARMPVPRRTSPTGKVSSVQSKFELGGDGVSLMVGCAVEMAAVFTDVQNEGLSCGLALPKSDRHDSVLCVCTADLDWDGEQELIVATYGQRLLVYKQLQDDAATSSLSGSVCSASPEHKLVWERSLAQPIYNVFYTDLIGDGLPELVVVTLLGIHIFQHDLAVAASHCTERLRVWAEVQRLRQAITEKGKVPCV